MAEITFSYKKANNEIKVYKVNSWKEVGNYIQGFSLGSNAVRTFRKDRIIQYLDNNVSYLIDPYPVPPVLTPKEKKLSIIFTGFAKNIRSELEQKAKDKNLYIASTILKDLNFICVGQNAGPVKVKKTLEQGAYIMDSNQFLALLETGELPDEEPEWLTV